MSNRLDDNAPPVKTRVDLEMEAAERRRQQAADLEKLRKNAQEAAK